SVPRSAPGDPDARRRARTRRSNTAAGSATERGRVRSARGLEGLAPAATRPRRVAKWLCGPALANGRARRGTGASVGVDATPCRREARPRARGGPDAIRGEHPALAGGHAVTRRLRRSAAARRRAARPPRAAEARRPDRARL